MFTKKRHVYKIRHITYRVASDVYTFYLAIRKFIFIINWRI